MRTKLRAVIVALALFSSVLSPLAAEDYDGGIYINLAQAFSVFSGNGLIIECAGHFMFQDALGLASKLLVQVKPDKVRFDAAAGAVWYPFEPMQGPYASTLLRLSWNESHPVGYELQLYPELAVGWMWNFGVTSSWATGLGVELSLGWEFGMPDPFTLAPGLAIWFGAPL